MEKYKHKLLAIFLAVFVASLCLNVHYCSSSSQVPVNDTVKVTYIDTVKVYKPILKDSTVIRYVTERLPTNGLKEKSFPQVTEKEIHREVNFLMNNVPKSDENVLKNPESAENRQNSEVFFGNVPDSVDVTIPITQNIYEDEDYTAYVSGYKPCLDSLIFKRPREITTVTKYQRPKRWSVGVQVGYGVTLKSTPQFMPYVGIGISYNFFSF